MHHKLVLGEYHKCQRSLWVHCKWGGRQADEVDDGGVRGEKGERLPVADRDGSGATVGLLGIAPAADEPRVTGEGREGREGREWNNMAVFRHKR